MGGRGDRFPLSVCIYEKSIREVRADTENARNIYEQAP